MNSLISLICFICLFNSRYIHSFDFNHSVAAAGARAGESGVWRAGAVMLDESKSGGGPANVAEPSAPSPRFQTSGGVLTGMLACDPAGQGGQMTWPLACEEDVCLASNIDGPVRPQLSDPGSGDSTPKRQPPWPTRSSSFRADPPESGSGRGGHVSRSSRLPVPAAGRPG